MNSKNETTAAIDIGSSSIKMTIYELIKGKYSVLEELRQLVKLGRDCFYDGKISRPTIDECVSILKKYKRLCEEYNVNKIITVASSAIKEAINIDIFIDNIRTLTGFDIEILTISKEAEYLYHALEDILDKNKDYHHKDCWAFMEIGAGSVELTVIDKDCIILTRSLPLGILRLKQMYLKEFKNEENFQNFLIVMVEHELQNLKQNFPKFKINRLFVIGYEIEELARIQAIEDKDILKLSIKDLNNLTNKIKNFSNEEIMHKLKIPYDKTETFYPASIILYKFSEFFKFQDIHIPKITLRDGIIKSQNNLHKKKYFSRLETQLSVNALNLGRSLNFDEKHAVKVSELALKIFDETKNIHYLGNLERSYLLAASLLHDIGSSISYRMHHKHSLYIIKSQEFYSFDARQMNIIANIARYHRRSGPKDSHLEYMALSHSDKMIVMKLASILRISDSLDNSHLQLIKEIEIEEKENTIIINANVLDVNKDQFFSEAYSFNYKKKLFEEFFGIGLILKIKG